MKLSLFFNLLYTECNQKNDNKDLHWSKFELGTSSGWCLHKLNCGVGTWCVYDTWKLFNQIPGFYGNSYNSSENRILEPFMFKIIGTLIYLLSFLSNMDIKYAETIHTHNLLFYKFVIWMVFKIIYLFMKTFTWILERIKRILGSFG